MPDNPYVHVLDRDSVPAAALQLKKQLDLMEQVINYGTQLMPRAWDSSQRAICDSILVFHLLRKVVAHLDSIHILLSRGAATGAMSELRAMLESSVLIDWLVKEDTEQKSLFMFVAKKMPAKKMPGIINASQTLNDWKSTVKEGGRANRSGA